MSDQDSQSREFVILFEYLATLLERTEHVNMALYPDNGGTRRKFLTSGPGKFGREHHKFFFFTYHQVFECNLPLTCYMVNANYRYTQLLLKVIMIARTYICYRTHLFVEAQFSLC